MKVQVNYNISICRRLGLEDFNKTECSKGEYKQMIMKAMKREDEINIRKKMEGKSKVKDLLTKHCNLEDYF